MYRKHAPPYCQRCLATFANEEQLKEHAQAEVPCTVQKGAIRHKGITPQQLKELKSRKRPNKDVGRTEEDRWVEMYTLLFPDIPRDRIPSPCEFLWPMTPLSLRLLTTSSDCDLKSHEGLPNVDAFLTRLLDGGDLHTRIARQLEERLRLIPGAQSNFAQVQLPDIIRSCIREELRNLQQQLLAGQESSFTSGTQVEPPAGGVDGPDSHGTAQAGSQFSSIPLPPEAPMPQEQRIPDVVLLDNNPDPWLPPQGHAHLDAIFRETHFPDPLAEGVDDFTETTDSNSNNSNNHSRHLVPTAAAFSATGWPSAMLAGPPMLSPGLLSEPLSFDGFQFAETGPASLHGTLANMPNSTFLFTQEDKSGNPAAGDATGHQMDQYRY